MMEDHLEQAAFTGCENLKLDGQKLDFYQFLVTYHIIKDGREFVCMVSLCMVSLLHLTMKMYPKQ